MINKAEKLIVFSGVLEEILLVSENFNTLKLINKVI